MRKINTRLWIRKSHRWVGLLVVLQLLAWTVGGLYFSLIPISEIRGEHLVKPPEELTTALVRMAIAPGQLTGIEDQHIEGVELIPRRGGLYYKVSSESGIRLFDATTGDESERISPGEAERIAMSALIEPAEIDAVTYIEHVPRGHEYRGHELPAYRIELASDSGLHLYVSAQTGEVTARRTDRWRIFDFLWMLHVMDYQDRDDFNHPLLTFAASVALFVLLSGILVWWNSTTLRKQRTR